MRFTAGPDADHDGGDPVEDGVETEEPDQEAYSQGMLSKVAAMDRARFEA
jgi:hypothetical protein